MNFKKKYKAFTLWEMMIALLITSLIVTMSYGAYRTFTDILNDDQDKLDSLSEIMILERDLYQLIDSCVSIELMDDFLYFNHRNSYTYMELGDSTLIRGDEDGENKRIIQIEDWSADFLNDHSDLIKTIRLSFVNETQTYNFTLRKIYPRTLLYSMAEE